MFAGDRDQDAEADIRLVRQRRFMFSFSGIGEAHRVPLLLPDWRVFGQSGQNLEQRFQVHALR
ncbi:hypothetical protein [Nocardia nova]|uniref:hypothetical protein n=1 Tax=Nocardia nova TaxID=37330 RepID=UPI000CEA0A8D|nr:hypothetical protein [Nocardia nova]PPJ25492.1 hypothetical protein C5E41_19810 [Nocardia nova]